MSNQYIVNRLPNGLRVVTFRSPGMVSYIGVVINAGSRDEDDSHPGLAHFVEHTIFKGTAKRRSWHISNRMEAVGGELNAYTSKEETVVYTSAPAGYAERAVELLSDLICNASFPEGEIEKEKDVVIEEIYSYRDSPADSVYDEFEDLIYKGCGLAHNILGTPESVKTLTGADCRRFIDRLYTPQEMVVYCCDSGDPAKNQRLIEKYFSHLDFSDSPRAREKAPSAPSFSSTIKRDSHQANTIMGCRLFDRKDPRRFPLFLLNNYLGGPCMNSVFNRELRDKRGLVYTVDSSVSLLSNDGLLAIYFGSDRDNVEQCRRLINREIDCLTNDPVSPEKFEKIRRQYCGQLLLTSDHKESRAMAAGKSLLYFDEVHDIDTSLEAIKNVTAEEMMKVARLISGNLSTLTLC